MAEANGMKHEAAAAESDAPPTYAEAFPALPISRAAGAAATPITRAIAPRSSSAIRSTTVSEIIRIPFEELRIKSTSGLSGNESEKLLAEIRKSTNATITASTGRDRALTISIAGKRSEITLAKRQLLEKLQRQAAIEMPIPKEHHRFIIGSEGGVRREIEEKYACRIKIPKVDDTSDVVVIMGTTENCRKAAAAVQAISDEKGKMDKVMLSILKAYHPLISGHNGATVARITAATGAKIHIPPVSADKNEIVVSGEKAAVAEAVRQLSAVYQELQATCGELTAKVPKSQHRFVIGPKGAHIKEIMEKTGVVVEVPPGDKDDETIILRGVQTNLVHALTMVYEKANSVLVVKLEVPGWLHKHIIGPKGANIQAISKDMPKVHLQCVAESNTIEIEGPPEQVTAVRRSIEALANELKSKLTFADVEVDPKFHGHIIGQNGASIRAIKNETNASINMPPTESNSSVIHIEGTPEAVELAKKRILELATKLKNQRNIDLIVPTKWHSQIIGQSGQRIRELTVQFPELSINFPQRDSESEIISIRGDKQEVEAAEAWFKKTLKQIEQENFEMEVAIFRRYHSEIIGKGGVNIRKIRDATGVRIDVPSAEENSDIITVTGVKANCEKAAEMMLQMQADIANIVTESLVVPQQLHGIIIGPGGKFIRSIQDEFEVEIVVGGKKSKTDEVVIRGPSESVPKAVAKIKEMVDGGADGLVVEEIKVDPKYHRYLIGRGGVAQQKIIADTGVVRFLVPFRKPKAGEAADAVVIIGTKAACAKAKALVEERIKALDSVVEESVELDPTYFKEMRARRGQFLRSLQEELNVRIDLPKQPEAAAEPGAAAAAPEGATEAAPAPAAVQAAPTAVSNVVRVRGSPADVETAIEKLKAFIHRAANAVTKPFEVAAVNLPSLMGARGVHVQRIQKEYDVSIEIPDRASRTPDQETVEMSISGLAENVDGAIAEFQALTPITAELAIPAEMHRFIIGQKGAGIREFQDQHEVRLEIPKAEEASDVIRIRGLPEKVEAAKDALRARLPDLEDAKAKNFAMKLSVPAKHHSMLIGQAGANVNKLRAEFDVRLDFAKAESADPDVITLTGYQEKCEACAKAILDQVHELESYVTKSVEIHNSIHGRIIGTRGAGVKKLQEEFKVRIVFPRNREDSVLEVVGPEAGVDECIVQLKALEEEFEEEILDYQATQAFVKPQREERKAAPAARAFEVRDAPWSGSQQPDEVFPTLSDGGAAAKATSSMGVWGRR